MSAIVINIEVTDTFGGEANYSWVKRDSLTVHEGTSDLAIVRRAKLAMGWAGVRCRREDAGETIILRPYGVCQVMFISASA